MIPSEISISVTGPNKQSLSEYRLSYSVISTTSLKSATPPSDRGVHEKHKTLRKATINTSFFITQLLSLIIICLKYSNERCQTAVYPLRHHLTTLIKEIIHHVQILPPSIISYFILTSQDSAVQRTEGWRISRLQVSATRTCSPRTP